MMLRFAAIPVLQEFDQTERRSDGDRGHQRRRIVLALETAQAQQSHAWNHPASQKPPDGLDVESLPHAAHDLHQRQRKPRQQDQGNLIQVVQRGPLTEVSLEAAKIVQHPHLQRRRICAVHQKWMRNDQQRQNQQSHRIEEEPQPLQVLIHEQKQHAARQNEHWADRTFKQECRAGSDVKRPRQPAGRRAAARTIDVGQRKGAHRAGDGRNQMRIALGQPRQLQCGVDSQLHQARRQTDAVAEPARRQGRNHPGGENTGEDAWQTNGPFVIAQNGHRGSENPGGQRPFIQKGHAGDARHDPVAGSQHFSRGLAERHFVIA